MQSGLSGSVEIIFRQEMAAIFTSRLTGRREYTGSPLDDII